MFSILNFLQKLLLRDYVEVLAKQIYMYFDGYLFPTIVLKEPKIMFMIFNKSLFLLT